MMRAMWLAAVPGVMTSRAAISMLVSPWATRAATSRSRTVNVSTGGPTIGPSTSLTCSDNRRMSPLLVCE
jgi:hypothetical protein